MIAYMQSGNAVRSMWFRRTCRGAIAAVACVMLAAPAGADERRGRVAEGAALARDACSACHQVSPRQKKPPPVIEDKHESGIPAPSFMKIARDRRKTADYLHAVISRPHYPMKEQVFDEDDLDDIIAYILSLRPPPAPR